MKGSDGRDEHHQRRFGASLLSCNLRELAGVREAKDAVAFFVYVSCDTGGWSSHREQNSLLPSIYHAWRRTHAVWVSRSVRATATGSEGYIA